MIKQRILFRHCEEPKRRSNPRRFLDCHARPMVGTRNDEPLLMKLSSTLKLSVSETIKMNGLALQKKAAGIRVFNLSAGEPMVDSHVSIIEGAQRAMREGKTHYPPVAGIPELREAFSEWMNVTYKTSYTSKQCIVTCGGKSGLYMLFQAILDPGDEVIMIAPYWVSYSGITEMFGGVPVVIPTKEENGWRTSREDIERACTPKTTLLVLNNASNPTGVLYTHEQLRSILEFAASKNITVVSDEVYSGLMYDNNEFVSCGSFPEFQENVVVIQSCSKHFAMTGWRVGFVLAPEPVIARLSTIQSQSTTGTSSISQWAALGAVQNAAAVIDSVRLHMQERRDVFTRSFNKLFSVSILSAPSGLYSFVSLKALGTQETDSMKFALRLLEEGNIATVPGAAFGQEGYVRFSFGAAKEELEAALQALKTFLS